MRLLFLFIFLFTFSFTGFSQCSFNVDFNTWVVEGDPVNGDWDVLGGGTSVIQRNNGDPSFFVSPQSYINVEMTGKMRTTDNDDDYMGVVFGYKNPVGNSTIFDTWMVDWKEETSGGSGMGGKEGLSLVKINGDVAGMYNPYFWDHAEDGIFDMVDSAFGPGLGWTKNTTHEIKVVYTLTKIIVIVDSDTIFNETGCYETGRFGFYNYSQKNVTYSDFDYKLKADFNLLTPQICVSDSLRVQSVCGIVPANIATWAWDFGDGGTSNDQNPAHKYATAGTYTIKLVQTDMLGCKDSVFETVVVNDLPQAILSNSVAVCVGDIAPIVTFTGSNGDAPYTFAYKLDGVAQTDEISTGNTSTLSITTAGEDSFIYSLDSVTDVNGCVQTQNRTTTVDINTVPTATITGTSTLCEIAGSKNITFTTTSGNAPFTFSYNDPLGAAQTIVSATSSTIIAQSTAASGVFNYSFTNISDVNACGGVKSESVIITVNSIPTATLSGGTTVCKNGSTPNITYAASNGTAPYTFTYNIGGANIPIIAPVSTTVLSHATNIPSTVNYNLVDIADNNGCSQSQSQTETVIVLSALTATVNSSHSDICEGDVSTWSIVGGLGTSPYTFFYSIDSVNRGTSSTGSISAAVTSTILSSPNTYADTLVMTITGISDASGLSCPTASASFDSVVVNAIPSSIISASLGDVCENVGGIQTITFDASANPGLPTPITFNYYYTVNGGPQISASVTSDAGNLTKDTTYNVPLTPGKTIFYNLSVSSSSCGGGIGGGSDTIVVNPLPTANINAISLQKICDNESTTIRFEGGNATAPYTFTYDINGTDNYTVTTLTGNYIDIVLDTLPGEYIYNLLTVTDSLGCSPTTINTAITFTVDAIPTATTTIATAITCEDATTTVTGVAGFGSILWTKISGPGSITSGETTGTPTFTGGGAATSGITILQMEVSSTNTCAPLTAISTATITTEPLPIAIAGGSATICENSYHTVINASASNGTILWTHNGGGSLADSTTSYPTYAAVASDTLAPVILIKTVTSFNNCGTATDTASYEIGIDKLPVAYAGYSMIICENTATNIEGANYANGDILWSVQSGPGNITSGANTLIPTYTAAGSGTANDAVLLMKVSSTNQCVGMFATSTTTITSDPLPIVTITTSNKTICEDATTSDIAGTTTNANKLWTIQSGPGTITGGETTSNPTFAGEGVGTAAPTILLLTASSNNTCVGETASATATIITDPLPLVTITTDNDTICESSSSSLIRGLASHGSTFWSVISGPGNVTNNATKSTPYFAGGGAGTANSTVLEMVVSSTNTCLGATTAATATVISQPLPLVEITTPPQTICEIGIATITGTATNGDGLWELTTNKGSLTSNGVIASYQAESTGTATIRYTVTSNNKCAGKEASAYTEIKMDPLPTAKVIHQINPEAVCSNASIQVSTASLSNANPMWSTNGTGILTNEDTLIPIYEASDDDEENVVVLSLLVSSNNTCDGNTATAEYLIYVNPLPNAFILQGKDQCEAEDSPIVSLIGKNTKPPYTFTYMVGEDDFTTTTKDSLTKNIDLFVPTHYSGEFTYSLQTVTDGYDCKITVLTENTDTVIIFRKPYADFILDKKITSLYEPKILLEEASIDATLWEWDFGDGSRSESQYPEEHSYSDSGSFAIILKVSNPSGCKDSVTQIVTIEKPTSVYIPSSFTPNGDGDNDTFLPKGDGIVEYSITIYNRWGVVVFSSNDITIGWDGNVGGTKPDAMDAYVYVVVVKDIKLHEKTYRGMINLVW